MTITAQSTIRRAASILQDNTAVRWPLNELVRWLNDGQREVILYRPDATVKNATLSLVQGTRQSIPADGTKLIEVVRNNVPTEAPTIALRSVRMVQREILDSQIPGWHAITPVQEVLHFMFDPRDPKTFYTYPPALATSRLDIVYSATPTDIAEPADGAALPETDASFVVLGSLFVPDIYANALLDYILYRAYSKDSDFAGNAARAAAHYGAFANSMGIEIKATVAVGPGATSAGNPNTGRTAV